MPYDVTVLSVRPASVPKALPRVQEYLAGGGGKLLACWYSEIGALNEIMIVREFESDQAATKSREAAMRDANPYGAGEFMLASRSDTFVMAPFIAALQAGSPGPFFEVRDYLLKPGVLAATLERWQQALPKRVERSPILAAMYSVSGVGPRWIHIWPYKSMDERHHVRTKAMADGIWPPPGGAGTLETQRTDIFVPATFSPLR
jgi:hypothetical protein